MFVTVIDLQPCLTFVSMAWADQSGATTFQSLLANIIQGLGWLTVAATLAYYKSGEILQDGGLYYQNITIKNYNCKWQK